MISQLFDNATKKAGNQITLAKMLGLTQQRLSAFKNYKTGDKRKPNDEVILKLAQYMGLNAAETLYQAKLELDPENAHLWQFLANDWRAQRELNPRPSASEADTLSN